MRNSSLPFIPSFPRLTAVALLAAGFAFPAHAEGKLEARYNVTMAGFAIGEAAWSLDIASGRYVSTASGKASGLMSVLASGEGAVTAHGKVKDGQLSPVTFTARVSHDDDKSDTTMVLDNGTVKELSAEAPKQAGDRVQVTEAHRRGIIDPVTALLVPVTSDGVGREACERTLPVFDGRRRYDLKLSFKRVDKVKAERGYAGPVVVCAVSFQPCAGHRASSKLIKYLSAGRDIELWLAPVAGAGVLAPFRASIASMVGSLVIEARQFDVARQTAAAQ